MKKENLSINDELKKEGYSQEERYFYKLNRELIEKRRKQVELPRDSRRPSISEPIRPARELETPKETKRGHFFLNILKKLFRSSEEPPRMF